MNRQLILLFLGVISSVFAGSYVSSKEKNCRSECRRNEQCELGYTCERVGCRFICVRKVIPLQPVVVDPLPVDGFGGINHRGDIVVQHEGRGGHFVDVATDISSPFDTSSTKKVIKPISSSDALHPVSPIDTLPIDSVFASNSADLLFLCIDNCVMSSQCVEGTDCVLGCKNMCENERSLIDISSTVPKGLKPSMLPLPNEPFQNVKPIGPVDHQFQGNSPVSEILPLDHQTGTGFPVGHFPVEPVSPLSPVNPVDPHVVNDLTGHTRVAVDQNLNVRPALPVDTFGQITQTDVVGAEYPIENIPLKPTIPLSPVKPIDSYVPTDLHGSNNVPVDQHLDINPDLPINSVGPLTPIVATGAGFPVENTPLKSPVKTLDSYVPNNLPGHKVLPVDPSLNIGDVVTVDSSGRIGPVGPIIPDISNGKPVLPHDPRSLNVESAVLVDSNGEIRQINHERDIIQHGTGISVHGDHNVPVGPVETLIPVAPRNCYKECNRDFHCGPHKVCVEKGCRRVCEARIDVLPIDPIYPKGECVDQCISSHDCPSGLICARRGCRKVCVRQSLGNDYKPKKA